jgi:hypothetical protein
MHLVRNGDAPESSRVAWRHLVAFATIGLAACGGSDGTGPNGDGPPVESVQLAGSTASIEVGETLQITATALDINGNVLSGRTITWTSTNQAVASVNTAGLVVGQTTGSATINATAEGKSGSYGVTVTPATIPTITSITPTTLVPGQPATITGEFFSVSAPNNLVTVAGTAATVTAASATSLTFNVPTALCAPGSAAVVVTVNGRASNAVNQPAELRGETVNIGIGQQQIIAQGNDPCLQFPATGNAEEYIIGVQYLSEAVTNIESLNVGLAAAGTAGAVLLEPFSAASVPLFSTVDAARAERWRRHRQAEIEFRHRERAAVEPFMADLAANRARTGLRAAAAAAAIPNNLTVGATVAIRVPDRGGNLCNDFAEVTTTVKALGNRSVWLEDNANPAGGFTTAEYNTLAAQFDNTIWAVNTDYFGMPSDIDGDGRIAIVITKEVNKASVLGFTSTTDQIPRANCASSNGGEVYYGIAVDAGAQHGSAYEKAAALLDAPLLIAHEFTHIIQFAIRLGLGATTAQQLPAIWELEGQATLAEEVNGHAFAGRSPGSNFGFTFAFNCENPPTCTNKPDPIDWYLGGFIDLVLYFGFETAESKVAGAPEQCSWLDTPAEGNSGPCLLEGREVYGVPWSLLRFISDQYGSQFAGGEAQLHRQLISGTTTGFANIERVISLPMRTILARWAASLYADDRVPGLDSSLRLTSWNLDNIRTALRESAQLVPKSRSFSGFNESVLIRAGSTAYYRVSGTNRPAGSFRVRTSSGGVPSSLFQVWVVRSQ